MSKSQLATYRLPITNAAKIGQARVVTDRNGRHYIEGSRVAETSESGIHTIVTLENGKSLYVLTKEYQNLK